MVDKEIRQVHVIVSLMIILVWITLFFSESLLHQLTDAPIRAIGPDNTYWILWSTGLPELLVTNKTLALCFDLLWFIPPVVLIFGFFARLLSLSCCIAFGLYYICSSSVSGIQNHPLVPLLMMSTLLLVDSTKAFVFLFTGLRYYICFIMFDAFLWKLRQGGLFCDVQMIGVLKEQHVGLFDLEDSSSTHLLFLQSIINAPVFSRALWFAGSVLEAGFFIGFFTRRYDKVLAFLLVSFVCADYIVMKLNFWNFLIGLVLFYPWKYIWKEYDELSRA